MAVLSLQEVLLICPAIMLTLSHIQFVTHGSSSAGIEKVRCGVGSPEKELICQIVLWRTCFMMSSLSTNAAGQQKHDVAQADQTQVSV